MREPSDDQAVPEPVIELVSFVAQTKAALRATTSASFSAFESVTFGEAVPVYFFDLHRGGEVAEDVEGQDLPDLHSAERVARRGVIELIYDSLRRGVSPLGWSFGVRDGDGRIALVLPFDDVFRQPRAGPAPQRATRGD
jgi:hypothetical protein